MKNNIILQNAGVKNSDLHFWGPGLRSCYIIHFVLSGKGHLEVNGKKYDIGVNSCFLTYPYSVIKYYPDEKDPWAYSWVDFYGDDADALLDNSVLNANHPVAKIKNYKALKNYFLRLPEIFFTGKNNFEAKAILNCILGLLLDENEFHENSAIDTALQLIHSNYYSNEFSCQDICESLGISTSTLHRMFEKEFGISPNQYLINYRIDEAKVMLGLGNSVKTTALSCGFNDPLYFSRLFKQRTGVMASKWVKAESQ